MPVHADTAKEEGRLLQQRRMFLFFVAVTLLFGSYELQLGGENRFSLGLVRACTVLATTAYWFFLPRASLRGRRVLLALSGVTSGSCLSAAALVQGDFHTTYFAWLFALPFVQLLIVGGDVRAALLSGGTVFIGATTVLVSSSATSDEIGQWLGSIGASAAIAVYASVLQRRLIGEEAAADSARIVAVESLAISSRRLAEAERLACVGQLAAGVAHEINNPLGFVVSNLTFLKEELAHRRLDDAEGATVLDESQVGLKRIGQIVSELSALANATSESTDLKPDLAVAGRADRARLEGRYNLGLQRSKLKLIPTR